MSDTSSSPETIETRELDLVARDGVTLRGTLFAPREGAASVAVVNSATAVPRRYYKHFATALARRGIAAVTYDYRGIGDSRPRDLRGFRASVRDWGLHDMPGVIDSVRRELSPDRVFLVGHSVGGQVAGLIDNPENVDAMVTFSSQSGYWALQGGEQKAVVFLHVHVTLPVLASTFGYMPWSRFGSAEDLPKDAALEWARWCRSPRYLLDDATLPLDRYKHFTAPVLAYSFGDDKWGTAKAVDAMMTAYPNLERRHVDPREVGQAIGHFGFFRPNASALWEEPIAWLERKGRGGDVMLRPSASAGQ